MTAQTKQDELQDMLYNNVLNFSIGEKPNEKLLFLDEAYPEEFKAMEKRALELINSEVLSVLEEVEKQSKAYDVNEIVGSSTLIATPMSDIQSIKNRYKL